MRIDLILAAASFVLAVRLADYEKPAGVLNIPVPQLRMHIAHLEELLGAQLLADDVDGVLHATEIGAELVAPLTAAVLAAAAEDPRIGAISRVLRPAEAG